MTISTHGSGKVKQVSGWTFQGEGEDQGGLTLGVKFTAQFPPFVTLFQVVKVVL